MDDSILPRLFILIVLLVLSAFFAASEAAFFSLNPHQVAGLRETRPRRGGAVSALLSHPRRLLITIYIGNDLVNIAVAAVTTSLAVWFLGDFGVGVAIGAGASLLLVFGEIFPKTLGIKFAEPISLAAAIPLKAFSSLVHPIQKRFIRLAEWFIALMGVRPLPKEESAFSEEEFSALVKMGEGEGIIESEERKMIHNVIEFSDTAVSEIMTPKVEMFTLNETEIRKEILPKIAENFYSRVPVYDSEEEQIIGILYTKDLNKLKHLSEKKFNLKSVLRPTIFVPETKKIKDLLQDFKKQKKHMAIVLDEYGSLSGLVTLEDILEEVVGDIDSEMRPEKNPIVQLSPNSYRLPAAYSLEDFNRNFESALPEDQFDTVGGLVFDLIGRVPGFGETATFDNFKFLVEKMKGPRILTLQLTVLNPESPDNGKAKPEANGT